MHALVLHEFGLENLRYGSIPDPDPATLAPGDVLLRIGGAALNSRDLRVVEGTYDPRFSLPLVPCSDAAGEVIAVGKDVTTVRPGDRVLPAFAPHWTSGPPRKEWIRKTWGAPLAGTATEALVAPASCLVPTPDHLDDVEASTLCCAGTTAYRALVELPDIEPVDDALSGRWVLCLGTGGVSVFAVQIAKALGARVAVVSSSEEKLELLRRMGADLTVDRRAIPDWGRHVRDATGGVDHVIEVGGAATLPHSLRAVRPGACISLIGVLGGSAAPLDLMPAIMNQIRIQGVLVGPRTSLAGVAQLFARHRLRPHVHATYTLAEGVTAFRELAGQRHVGKICLRR